MGLAIALAFASAVAGYGAYRIGTKPTEGQVPYLIGLIVVSAFAGGGAIFYLF